MMSFESLSQVSLKISYRLSSTRQISSDLNQVHRQSDSKIKPRASFMLQNDPGRLQLVSCMHHADATILLSMFRYNNMIYYQTSFRKEETLSVYQRGKYAIGSRTKSFKQTKQAINNLERYQNNYLPHLWIQIDSLLLEAIDEMMTSHPKIKIINLC